jgi:7-alpha-hydroxysteroid dehydrogenase
MFLERFLVPGQVAIITGGSSGIGRATAHVLSEAGATVAIASRSAGPLFKVADEIRALGRYAFAMPTDVNNPNQLDALVKRVSSELGRIDILVNVAGGTPPTAAMGLSDQELEEAFHFNVTSAFHLSKACAPYMSKQGNGSIVNITSAMSHRVDSGFVAYGTAKAALSHMTRLLAHEWAPKIRVNAIAAGATLTNALQVVSLLDGVQEQMELRTPMARLGDPVDIGLAALYLASSAASYVTGKIIEVDGGAPGSVWPLPISNDLP